MQHAIAVDVHEVVRLSAVLATRSGIDDLEVLRVAGRRGDGDGDAGERRMRRVVQVTAEDATDIRPLHDRRQPVLVAQFDERQQSERTRHGWVVQCEQGSVRGGDLELVREPLELRLGDLAVVMAGNRGIQRDDPQPVDVEDAVDGLRGIRVFVEQPAPERDALVVVAHHPDHLGAEALGCGLDDGAQPLIRVGASRVGEIAREHDGLGPGAGLLETLEQRDEIAVGVDSVVQEVTGRHEVGVGEVQDEVLGGAVLAGGDHALFLSGAESSTSAARRRASSSPVRPWERR